METSEARGTFACPICGVETPHGHTDWEIREPKLRRAFEDLYARKVGGLELDYPGSSTGKFVGADARMEPLRVSGYGLRWMWSQRTTDGYREPKIQALWLFFVAVMLAEPTS